MALFGSYSRGEETVDSDVDVMVELAGSIGIRKPKMGLIMLYFEKLYS